MRNLQVLIELRQLIASNRGKELVQVTVFYHFMLHLFGSPLGAILALILTVSVQL